MVFRIVLMSKVYELNKYKEFFVEGLGDSFDKTCNDTAQYLSQGIRSHGLTGQFQLVLREISTPIHFCRNKAIISRTIGQFNLEWFQMLIFCQNLLHSGNQNVQLQ